MLVHGSGLCNGRSACIVKRCSPGHGIGDCSVSHPCKSNADCKTSKCGANNKCV
ncbi:5794_t:CDS:2 [Gigaspora margarita]|uniref:5794_t:CDS:1 n=1 Tax=Gigaspora margarita TaxID=4874 RepID=A0ABN7UNV2_GIGMA|nr:5794_t:CDS:2 [Gigaspora margarita]